MTPESDWAEINLANLDGKSNPAINQVSIQHFNVVTKDARRMRKRPFIKLLNLSLVTNSNSTFDKAIFEGKDLAEKRRGCVLSAGLYVLSHTLARLPRTHLECL